MSDDQQSAKGGGFTHTVAKRALAPIVASAATAATAYLMRKGTEVWEQRLRPKIEEKGGGKAVASEALGGLRERLPASATEKLDALTATVGDGERPLEQRAQDSAGADGGARDEERRKREQRRQQRRRILEQAGSS